MRVAYGIFGWWVTERTSNRYGAFYLSGSTFDETVQRPPSFDTDAVAALLGQRVRITCRVVESRKSGHAGDLFLDIKPARPKRGARIDLGVGILGYELIEGTYHALQLVPGDGRKKFWYDPRQLYRLHDQTVEVDVEPTTDDFHAAPEIACAAPGVISNGDGSFQVKDMELTEDMGIKPNVTSLGGGMFVLDSNHRAGQRVDVIRKRG